MKTMYVAWMQRDNEQPTRYSYVARVTGGDPVRLSSAAERVVRGVDPPAPGASVDVLHDHPPLDSSGAAHGRRWRPDGPSCPILAGVGLFGVLAFQVARRTNESGRAHRARREPLVDDATGVSGRRVDGCPGHRDRRKRRADADRSRARVALWPDAHRAGRLPPSRIDPRYVSTRRRLGARSPGILSGSALCAATRIRTPITNSQLPKRTPNYLGFGSWALGVDVVTLGTTPTYLARGRISCPVAYCSIACPIQPTSGRWRRASAASLPAASGRGHRARARSRGSAVRR